MKRALLLSMMLLSTPAVADGEWWASPGAISWHDSNRFGKGALPVRNFNPGLLIRYRWEDSSEVVAGGYQNSFVNTSWAALYRPAWSWCSGMSDPTWRVNCTPYAGAVTGYRAPLVNQGPDILRPRMAVLPALSIEHERGHGLTVTMTPKQRNWPMTVSFLYMYRWY